MFVRYKATGATGVAFTGYVFGVSTYQAYNIFVSIRKAWYESIDKLEPDNASPWPNCSKVY